MSPSSGRGVIPSHCGPPTAPTSTASAPWHAWSVWVGSGRLYAPIPAPPNSCSSKDMPSAISTRTASPITSGPMPSPGRHTNLGAMDLPVRQVEHVAEERRDAFGGEWAVVGRLQLDHELLLAVGIQQRNA